MSGFFTAPGEEEGALSRRFRIFAIGIVIGAALIVLAVAFLALAAYLALLNHLAPWLAALAVAGGALLFGAILLAIAVKSLNRAVKQVKVAVKTNTVARAAPFAAGLAVRNPRLVAGVAAAVAAAIGLVRAFSGKSKAADTAKDRAT